MHCQDFQPGIFKEMHIFVAVRSKKDRIFYTALPALPCFPPHAARFPYRLFPIKLRADAARWLPIKILPTIINKK